MGAACTTMYAVRWRLLGRPHQLHQAILLSPAGFHMQVRVVRLLSPECPLQTPLLARLSFPLLALLVRVCGIKVFRFPGGTH
jgi:hypothetical protein